MGINIYMVASFSQTPIKHLDNSLKKILLIDFREREGERGERKRERNIDLLFHLILHSFTCSDQGSNLHPYHMGMMR